MSHFACQVLGVTCHVLFVRCQVLHVTCHQLTPTAKAIDPPPANSPIMHSRLLCKDPKAPKKSECKKILQTAKIQKKYRGMPIYSDILFDQKSTVHWEARFLQWRRQTHRHMTDGHGNVGNTSKSGHHPVHLEYVR